MGARLSPLPLPLRLCETVVPLEDPIITETTSTLQEWGVLWKQLYVVSRTVIRRL